MLPGTVSAYTWSRPASSGLPLVITSSRGRPTVNEAGERVRVCGAGLYGRAMGSDEEALLAEQVAYYRAGAAEYDRAYAVREELQGFAGEGR
jgi:hypothetical protein